MQPVCNSPHYTLHQVGSRHLRKRTDLRLNSGADKEEQEVEPDQVQSSVQALPLHPRSQGLGQGGEAEAELTPEYVSTI